MEQLKHNNNPARTAELNNIIVFGKHTQRVQGLYRMNFK